MHNGQTFGQYPCTFTQVFIPYQNFEYTKAVTLHCGKSGGGGGGGGGVAAKALQLKCLLLG